MKVSSPEEMIADIKLNYGLNAPRVFEAMRHIKRIDFAPSKFRKTAYQDQPIPIGEGQTMSQPYTVALMTHILIEKIADLENAKVLEIGTGSGYQAAILSYLFEKVYTIEIIESLCKNARKTFAKLGIENVFVKCASGEFGWKKKAPFDAIIITAGVEGESAPRSLLNQLAQGGVLVAPVGKGQDKKMKRYHKKDGKLKTKTFGRFHFVPFVREKKNQVNLDRYTL